MSDIEIRGETLLSKFAKLKKPPLKQLGKIVVESKKLEMSGFGWTQLPKFVKQETLEPNISEGIYIEEGTVKSPLVSGNRSQGFIQAKTLALFLDAGTQGHNIPLRNAKALHWGDGKFSKGHYVKGIIGMHFWRLEQREINLMNDFTNKWIAGVMSA